MKASTVAYLHKSFSALAEYDNFKINDERRTRSIFFIEYISSTFSIRIEMYRSELYLTLNKVGDTDNEVDLFNLLDYLCHGRSGTPKANYFAQVRDLEIRYRKQIDHLVSTITNNYNLIKKFFTSKSYSSQIVSLEKFIVNKYPDLFQSK